MKTASFPAVPNPQQTPFIPRPLREQPVMDVGGIAARKGFAFQDHVAALFCLKMLTNPDLVEVWCETYDDVVLITRLPGGNESVEFVQVKNEELDQLYSPSKLAQRKNAKTGTSLFEHSLSRDNCTELVRFRLVTRRNVQPVLRCLCMSRDDGSREPQAVAFDTLKNELLEKPAGTTKSPNGNDVEFWIEQTLWDVHTPEGLAAQNKLGLSAFLESEGVPVFIDIVDDLYDRLLWRAKNAAEADIFTQRDSKILLKNELKKWLLDQATPVPGKGSNDKLQKKLHAAGIAEDTICSAIQMRFQYNRELRQPKYMEAAIGEMVSGRVRGTLHQLQCRLDSGDFEPEGQPFHLECSQRVTELMHAPQMPSALTEEFLLGCMYEVTSRCRHRFVRPSV